MAKVVLEADMVQIPPNFGTAIVTVLGAAQMPASGSKTHNGKRVCVEGDGKLLRVPATYLSPPYVVPGQGTLSIGQLGVCRSRKMCDGKPIVVQGGPVSIEFTVTSPAMQSSPTGGMIPDPMPKHNGMGQFLCQPTNPDENELA